MSIKYCFFCFIYCNSSHNVSKFYAVGNLKCDSQNCCTQEQKVEWWSPGWRQGDWEDIRGHTIQDVCFTL